MAIAEPADPFGLWTEVRPMTEWPATDEDMVAELSRGWAGGRDALGSATDGIEAAGRAVPAAWRDDVGGEFAGKLHQTGRLRSVAAGMGTVSAHAARFEQVVRDTKSTFVATIAANAPAYGLMSLLPDVVGAPLKARFAADVAGELNRVLAAGESSIAGGPDPGADGLWERLVDGANSVGEGLYEGYSAVDDAFDEAADDAWTDLDSAGLTPDWLDDWRAGLTAEDEAAEAEADAAYGPDNPTDREFERRARAADDAAAGIDRLEVAVNRDVDVYAIEPDPVWRESDEPLYRSDNRKPEDIFQTGFGPRDPDNVGYEDYVKKNTPSAFVSTTRAEDLYLRWKKPSYVYTLDAPGGIDANATIPDNPYHRQEEISFPGGIQPRYIAGAYPVDPKGNLGQWIPNPDFDPD